MAAILATEQQEFQLKTLAELHPVLSNINEVVVLDLETTGFSLEKFADIIEIGALKLDVNNRKVVSAFSQLIRPTQSASIPSKITELTRITWQQLENQPYIEDVLPVFYNFIGSLPVVIHNAKFDWTRFLLPGFRQVGLHADNEVICSMNMAKELYPGLGRSGYNLAALCKMFGSSIEGHHRAYVDCKWTAALFLKLLDKYKEIYPYGEQGFVSEKTRKNAQVDFTQLKINRINGYKSPNKKIGQRIYVNTNFGKLHYSILRHLWTVDELWTDENAPAQIWGREILRNLDMDIDEFVKRFSVA